MARVYACVCTVFRSIALLPPTHPPTKSKAPTHLLVSRHRIVNILARTFQYLLHNCCAVNWTACVCVCGLVEGVYFCCCSSERISVFVCAPSTFTRVMISLMLRYVRSPPPSTPPPPLNPLGVSHARPTPDRHDSSSSYGPFTF